MKKNKAAHHGGAWKVAYADFVTAMMALFMVLWISAQDQEILLATSQYFQSPFNTPLDATSGILPYNSNATPTTVNPESSNGKDQASNALQNIDREFMNSLAQEFYKLLNLEKTDEEAPLLVEVTSDGLRVTLFDRPNRPLFALDSTEFTEWGQFAMQNLAWVIDRNGFCAVVEGHTRTEKGKLVNSDIEWELSTAQANAVRKTLTHYAVDPSRFLRISGYGAREPLLNKKPEDYANQRIVISLSLRKEDATPKP
ncbi:MAG: flagellar motor protein MotB [Verrucomicrobiota bacterium]|nr:flagellar motor protein MotB [Verrucomicrobiota bacterium]